MELKDWFYILQYFYTNVPEYKKALSKKYWFTKTNWTQVSSTPQNAGIFTEE